MITYITKAFGVKEVAKIDKWLNTILGLEAEEVPHAIYNFSIVGYGTLANKIVITLLIWDARPKKTPSSEIVEAQVVPSQAVEICRCPIPQPGEVMNDTCVNKGCLKKIPGTAKSTDEHS